MSDSLIEKKLGLSLDDLIKQKKKESAPKAAAANDAAKSKRAPLGPKAGAGKAGKQVRADPVAA